jgi:hypothetical protein
MKKAPNLEIEKCRASFEKHYGEINELTKRPSGEYVDWNLELTWKCWEESWSTCKKSLDYPHQLSYSYPMKNEEGLSDQMVYSVDPNCKPGRYRVQSSPKEMDKPKIQKE